MACQCYQTDRRHPSAESLCCCPAFRLDPLLLTGPPGVGKSMFARRIAELAGAPFTSVSCAGSSDNRAFAGTGRGWSSTQSCLPLLTAARFRTANPVILVDEIDKDRKEVDNSGRISDSLLYFLEPETARRYFDESLMAEADLRPVSWICTANSLEGISPVLMSRLHVIEVSAPVLDSQSFPVILAGMKRELASEIGLRVEELPDLPRSVEGDLLDLYQKTGSLRKLARALRRILAMAVETD